jgi:hypothetical protein
MEGHQVDDMVEWFAERCCGYGTDVDLCGISGIIRKHQVLIDANFATPTLVNWL